jgi:hypothetical protein
MLISARLVFKVESQGGSRGPDLAHYILTYRGQNSGMIGLIQPERFATQFVMGGKGVVL